MLEDKIQESSDYLFWFSIGYCVVDQRSGDGRFIGRILNPRDWLLHRIVQTVRCWTRRLLLHWTSSSRIHTSRRRSVSRSRKPIRSIFFEQNHPEFPLQEKCQSGGTESSERGSVLARETDRLHFLRLLSSYWCSWYRTWWRRSIFNYSDDVQEFDARWDEMLLSMTRNPPDDVLESLYKLSIRESAQLKTVLELYDMEIHQKISMPNDQNFEDDGEKEYISEAAITKLRCQKW